MDKMHVLSSEREFVDDRMANALIGTLFFIIATTLGAYVRIPLEKSPVPITLQTFFVMLCGAVLGKRLGGFAQFGYLLAGAFGLPVFQGCAFGVPYVFGPTGGYLMGFVLAAYLIGRMTESGAGGMARVIISFIIGDALIHVCGAFWLACLFRLDAVKAFSAGILPFIPGEIFKILFAAIIYSSISRRSRKIFSI